MEAVLSQGRAQVNSAVQPPVEKDYPAKRRNQLDDARKSQGKGRRN
jgi:hypothetical protein